MSENRNSIEASHFAAYVKSRLEELLPNEVVIVRFTDITEEKGEKVYELLVQIGTNLHIGTGKSSTEAVDNVVNDYHAIAFGDVVVNAAHVSTDLYRWKQD